MEISNLFFENETLIAHLHNEIVKLTKNGIDQFGQ